MKPKLTLFALALIVLVACGTPTATPAADVPTAVSAAATAVTAATAVPAATAAQAEAPTTAPAAATPVPAATDAPTATEEPAATEDPTATETLAPTEEPTAAPTSAAAQGFQQVVIGDLETYTYPGGLFSIDAPVDWVKKDNSKPGEAIVLWTDTTENGLLAVDVFEQTQPQSEEQLTTFLKDFLSKTFGNSPDFAMEPPRAQSDGSFLIIWSYTATARGGIQGKLLGNSFIEQRGDKLSLLSTLVPDEQFAGLSTSTDKILNSYKINPSAALP